MSYYVDVILPIPMNQKFTYLITSEEFEFIKPGMRIVVPFGKSKLYTSIAFQIHKNFQGNYDLKSITQIIDKIPIVNSFQLKFWDWVSRYYFSPIGDVMRASIPSNLILQSETIITLDPDTTFDDDKLDEFEFLIIEAIRIEGQISIKDVSDIINKKNIFSIITKMSEKRLIRVNEKIYSKYKPKLVKCVRIDKNLKLKNVELILKNAKVQHNIYKSFLKMKSDFNSHVKVSDFKKISPSYSSAIKKMVDKQVFEYYHIEVKRNFIEDKTRSSNLNLSENQKVAFNKINHLFEKHNVILFKGVTSSGKTEIYISLIKKVLKSNQQVLYLVPEIALTTQLVERLKVYFSENLIVYHSGLNINQRAELWSDLIKNDKPQIIIGARSSIFLPFSNLKLIIVDEEHEQTYKQFEPSPRYHARDSSLILANIHNSKVLLGSATPSIESYFNCEESNKFSLVELNERYGNIELPKINIVDLSKKIRTANMHGLFSDTLLKNISDTVERNKQVILFQNRRGYSPVLECNNCGYSPRCVNCDVSLTYHYSKNILRCHYCGYNEKTHSTCHKCQSKDFLSKGFGTEQVEIELKGFFPDLKVIRLDHDTTRRKRSFKKIINSFENHDYDVLIGTQMVTKGLDFRNVSLVGVMNLDNSINFPDFRSYERCYQLVQQVAGRSGRSKERGEVIIQTYNSENNIISHIISGDYKRFYENQIRDRKKFNYPPFIKLIKITLKHKDLNRVNGSSNWFFNRISPYFKNNLLGPEFPYIARIRNKYQKNILIKIPKEQSLSGVKKIIKKSIASFHSISDYRSVQVIVDVDPY